MGSRRVMIRMARAGRSPVTGPVAALLLMVAAGDGAPSRSVLGTAAGGTVLSAAAHDLPLIEAVKIGNSAAARRLIQQRADVNAPDVDGTTPLHWAVYRADLETVALLIQAGARAGAANRYGMTPLLLACVNGHAAVVQALLKAGADPNTRMPEGDTALMTAARTGDVGTVKALLAAGADVNARESWKGQTALMWAAAENNAAVVTTLVEAGADIRARSRGPDPRDSAGEGKKTGNGMIIGRKYDAFTPFMFAVRAGQIDAVRALLAAGADVNEALPGGMSALVLATAGAHYDLAAFLLERGADPNAAAQGWTALHQIAWTRRPNYGANIPGPVSRGDVDSLAMVRTLLARGADINARVAKDPDYYYIGRNGMSYVGATALVIAGNKIDPPLVRHLLDSGADTRTPTKAGITPLMAAAGVGLWSQGENPGTAEEATETVTLLLARGVDVTAIDAEGNTALHGAALRGFHGAVHLLIARGAKLDVKNTAGWTPWRVAEGIYVNDGFKRAPETAALLRQFMQDRGVWAEK